MSGTHPFIQSAYVVLYAFTSVHVDKTNLAPIQAKSLSSAPKQRDKPIAVTLAFPRVTAVVLPKSAARHRVILTLAQSIRLIDVLPEPDAAYL